MEEKQEKKQEPEYKGKMGIVWLVGILVILLGCITVYTLKITKENKELKQTPLPQPIVEEKQVQAEEESANAVTTEETKAEVEDKDAKKVYGIDTKFKEVSKVAIKSIDTYEQKKDEVLEKNINYSYDFDNDGNKEKITGKATNLKFNGKTFYKSDVEDRCEQIYVVDLDKTDNYVEVVLEIVSGTGAGDSYSYDIYRVSNGKIKQINYSEVLENNYIATYKMYANGNGKFILLDQLQNNITPIFTFDYYVISNNKITSKKIDMTNVSKETFIISKNKDKDFDKLECLMTKSEKELKQECNKENYNIKKFSIKEDTKIHIISYKNGTMKVKLENGESRCLYSRMEIYNRFII